MKAHVKINVVIHFEDNNSQLASHRAGVVEVVDISEGERVVRALENHINTTFAQMGVTPVQPGAHKPDLALALGGDPEPKKVTNGDAA